MKRIAELRFHNSGSEIRRRVLGKVAAAEDVRILSYTADKRKARNEILRGREKFYRLTVRKLIIAIAQAEAELKANDVIVDARPAEKSIGREFDEHIRASLHEACASFGREAPDVRISRLDSLSSPGLQVVDFVAGAIRRRNELGDEKYYSMIASKLIELP